MRRAPAIIGSAIFLVIAPGTLAVYVPWYFTQWHFEPALFIGMCAIRCTSRSPR
jgi:Kef-type K+ transport system membrane component KefB